MANSSASPADPQREEITRLLADGLQTQTTPIPEDQNQFELIASDIRAISPGDLQAKAVTAGLIDRPFGDDQQRCQECMYYLLNRRWCDLPDMNMPVEPDWWCRLWRI